MPRESGNLLGSGSHHVREGFGLGGVSLRGEANRAVTEGAQGVRFWGGLGRWWIGVPNITPATFCTLLSLARFFLHHGTCPRESRPS